MLSIFTTSLELFSQPMSISNKQYSILRIQIIILRLCLIKRPIYCTLTELQVSLSIIAQVLASCTSQLNVWLPVSGRMNSHITGCSRQTDWQCSHLGVTVFSTGPYSNTLNYEIFKSISWQISQENSLEELRGILLHVQY